MRCSHYLIFAACFAFHFAASAVAQDEPASPDVVVAPASEPEETTSRAVVRLELWMLTLGQDAVPDRLAEARQPFDSREDVEARIKELQRHGVVTKSRYLMATTMDDQLLSMRIENREPTVMAVNIGNFGLQRQIKYEDFGLLLQVRSKLKKSDSLLLLELKFEESHQEPTDVDFFEPKEGSSINAWRGRSLEHHSTVSCKSNGAVVIMATDGNEDTHGSPIVIYLAATVED